MTWMKAGTAWIRAMLLQAQLLRWIWIVPREMKSHTRQEHVSPAAEGVLCMGDRTAGTKVPKGVVDCCDFASMLRMADLRNEDGTRQLRKRVAKSDHEAPSKVHC